MWHTPKFYASLLTVSPLAFRAQLVCSCCGLPVSSKSEHLLTQHSPSIPRRHADPPRHSIIPRGLRDQLPLASTPKPFLAQGRSVPPAPLKRPANRECKPDVTTRTTRINPHAPARCLKHPRFHSENCRAPRNNQKQLAHGTLMSTDRDLVPQRESAVCQPLNKPFARPKQIHDCEGLANCEK